MPHFPQSDVTKLSGPAQALIHRLLDQDALPNEIRRAVQRLSGERVMLEAIARYASSYAERRKPSQQAHTETDAFIRLLGKKGVKVSELLRAVLIEKLTELKRKKQFTKPDLYKLDDAERKRREFELKQKQERASARNKKKEWEIKEREMQLEEQRWALDRDQLRATLGPLERKAQAGEPLRPDDLRRIREIYGLEEEPEATETPRHGENET